MWTFHRQGGRVFFLTAILTACGWVGVGAEPAEAQIARVDGAMGTILVQMQGAHTQYGLSVFVEERGAGRVTARGVLVVEFEDGDGGLVQARMDITHGRLKRDEDGQVVGACLEGISEVTLGEVSVQRGRPTRVCVAGDCYEIAVRLRGGIELCDRGTIDVGENRFVEGFRAVAHVAGVGVSTDRTGASVRLATASAKNGDDVDVGGIAAVILGRTSFTIEGDIEDATVNLSRRGEVESVLLTGLAAVEHDGESCVAGYSAAIDVMNGSTIIAAPTCGAESTAQANRRYLYFAKVAD
jgi:hypothetical protein